MNMKNAMPITGYQLPQGTRRDFVSILDMERQLGVSHTYAASRKNTGKPCRGWLFFDRSEADTPATMAILAQACEGFNPNTVREQAERLVSVRIDSKTVILVKASKLRADHAEHYRKKLADNRAALANGFIQRNDRINQTKPRKGRPKKYE